MKSTGFGVFILKIVVTVPQEHARTAAERLHVEPAPDPDDPARVVFEVPLTNHRRGDDETVVYELHHQLGPSGELGWKVKWEESEY